MENLEAASEADGRVAANDDVAVFDVANKNLQVAFEVDTAIPSAKALARRELADLMASAPAITVCRYRPPRGPNKWKPRKYAAANDNDAAPLPIIEALRRDRRHDDIPWIIRYRLLCEVVGTSPYDDELDISDEGISIENRSLHVSGKNFDRLVSAGRERWLDGCRAVGRGNLLSRDKAYSEAARERRPAHQCSRRRERH